MIHYNIAIVVSQYNQDMTTALKIGALDYLKESGLPNDQITVVEVPGAVEIPVVAQRLAKQRVNQQRKFQAIIALGAVIRGETDHYDYVCQQVSYGCQRIALTEEIPVIFCVLTTENDQQVWDRLGGVQGHKGKEAAECALHMCKIMEELT